MPVDAVALTYLEWARLVGRGWLRLDTSRIERLPSWSCKGAEYAFDCLMQHAPDVGLRSADYVIAELEFSAWTPLSEQQPMLGNRLNLSQVRRFLCLDQSGQQVLESTASSNALRMNLLQPSSLWIGWVTRVQRASSDSRANELLEILGFDPAHIPDASEFYAGLRDFRAQISGESAYQKSKGTLSHGWFSALAAAKRHFDKSAGVAIRELIQALQTKHDVAGQFFRGEALAVAENIASDSQYVDVVDDITAGAAYFHYSYLMQRAEYKSFDQRAFAQDVRWLSERAPDAAVLLIDSIARDMTDELLAHAVARQPALDLEPAATHANLIESVGSRSRTSVLGGQSSRTEVPASATAPDANDANDLDPLTEVEEASSRAATSALAKTSPVEAIDTTELPANDVVEGHADTDNTSAIGGTETLNTAARDSAATEVEGMVHSREPADDDIEQGSSVQSKGSAPTDKKLLIAFRKNEYEIKEALAEARQAYPELDRDELHQQVAKDWFRFEKKGGLKVFLERVRKVDPHAQED